MHALTARVGGFVCGMLLTCTLYYRYCVAPLTALHAWQSHELCALEQQLDEAIRAPKATALGQAMVQRYAGVLRRSGGGYLRPVTRLHTMLQDSVARVEPAMQLYVFGSTVVYGCHEPGSDVDLVALCPADCAAGGARADATSELAKSVEADFLGRLAHELRTRYMAWRVDLVRRTRVPVLRVCSTGSVTDSSSNNSSDNSSDITTSSATNDDGRVCCVNFDITAHRQNGVRNSALLRAYMQQTPHARLLSMAVKAWSKRAGVNAAVEGGCLTSYGFHLMVAYFLLQRQLVRFVEPATCDVATTDPLPTACMLSSSSSNYNDDGDSDNNDNDDEAAAAEVGALAYDFLHYYLHEFDATRHVISLSRPGVTLRSDLQWTQEAEDLARIRGEKAHYRWCIEDPYEHNLNVGRKVTSFKLMLLRKHLERAVDTGMLLLPW